MPMSWKGKSVLFIIYINHYGVKLMLKCSWVASSC